MTGQMPEIMHKNIAKRGLVLLRVPNSFGWRGPKLATQDGFHPVAGIQFDEAGSSGVFTGEGVESTDQMQYASDEIPKP